MIKQLIRLISCAAFLYAAPAGAQRAAQIRDTSDRLLVVSGGGARGAWGVGVVEGILERSSVHYSGVFGTSTGSLMAPLILLDSIERLKIAYKGVRQENIFNVNPFKVKVDATGNVKADIRPLNAILRLLFKKPTLGETQPLRARIKQYFRPEDYDRIKSAGKNLSVAVTNMTTGMAEIKSSNDYTYAEMCDWIWASANEPVWMSFLERDGNYYVDGGVRDVIPLRQALRTAYKDGYQRLDVIINNSRNFLEPFPEGKGKKFSWLKTLVRTLQVYNAGTVHNDVAVGELMAKLHNLEIEYQKLKAQCASGSGHAAEPGIPLTIRLYFMPEDLAKKYAAELAFFPGPMQVLMEAGKRSVTQRTLRSIEFKILNNEAVQGIL